MLSKFFYLRLLVKSHLLTKGSVMLYNNLFTRLGDSDFKCFSSIVKYTHRHVDFVCNLPLLN